MFHRVLSLAACAGCFCAAQTVLGQTTNAWTSPGSGNWEDMHWSLGQLPGSGQSVVITNSGWKAVAISANTVANFPQTLSPTSVVLASPVDSLNVLLLNFAGFTTPLTCQQLIINSNATLTSLASAIKVNDSTGGGFSIGGTLNQGNYSVLSTAIMRIGDIGPGAFNMTNGSVAVSANETVGGNFPAYFRQFDGTNYCQNLTLLTGGEYDLYGGDLTAAFIYHKSGNLKQMGGVVKPDKMYVTMSTYTLAGGIFSCPDVELPNITSQFDYADLGFFAQTGGTNNSGFLSIGNYYPPFHNASAFGAYTLSDGALVTSSTSVGPWGRFSQSAGTHTSGGLGLHGTEVYIAATSDAIYSLSGGILSTPTIAMSVAQFSQTGGTNQVSGNLTLNWQSYYNAYYGLSAGLLQTSNTTITCTAYGAGGFTQSGGTHTVSNLLTVSRLDSSSGWTDSYLVDYLLTGGLLNAPNIRIDAGAVFHLRGGTLVNSGMLTFANGILDENVSQAQFGKVMLGPGTNSQIYLPGGSCLLRFADSSGLTWSNQALLTIDNWNGSVSGGGSHQIYFGNNTSGLSAAQLAQIQFENPVGSAGTYPATILSSGEIVPTRFIAAQKNGNTLQISWAPGTTLQSATNVAGPYQDVSGASSPYNASFTGPAHFFRLRQAAPPSPPPLIAGDGGGQ